MARGRMLNKSVSASLKFHNLSCDTCRLLATWIIPHLDKNGVYHGEAALVRSYIFPFRDDITTEQVESYLQELETVGLMHRFCQNGRSWQHWPGFDENQPGLRKEREGTEYPNPPDSCGSSAGVLPDVCGTDDDTTPLEVNIKESKSNGMEVKPKEDSPQESDADFQAVRQAWSQRFPNKPQPRTNNTTLQGKLTTRLKSPHFRENWQKALERASRSDFLQASSWFDLGWFLQNDDHYERCLNGKYDNTGPPPPRAGPGKPRQELPELDGYQ